VANQSYVTNLANQNLGPYTAVTAAAITALCPDVNLPAGFWLPGTTLRYRAFGKVTTAASTPGTFTIQVVWGGTGGTVIATSGSQSWVASATTLPWELEVYLQCMNRSVTATPTWSCFAQGWFRTVTGVIATPPMFPLASSSVTAPASITGLSDAAQALDLSITMSASTNSITCNLMTLESVGL
jgi:hypothetical protein